MNGINNRNEEVTLAQLIDSSNFDVNTAHPRWITCISALRKRLHLLRLSQRIFKMITDSNDMNVLEIKHSLQDSISTIEEISDDCLDFSDFIVGFNCEVSRRMVGPAPVRKCTLLPSSEAYIMFKTSFSLMLDACNVMSCKTFDQLVWFIQKYCDEDVGILPRSFLWLVIFRNGGSWLKKLIFKALYVPGVDLISLKSIHDFVSERVLDPATMLLKAYCSNPGRQRRHLANSFNAWADLLTSSVNLDKQLEKTVRKTNFHI